MTPSHLKQKLPFCLLKNHWGYYYRSRFLAQNPKGSDSVGIIAPRWFYKQSLRNTDLLKETKVPFNDAS